MNTISSALPAGPAEFRAAVALRRRRLAEQLDELFPGPAEVTLEIGCGHGHFLTGYAREQPEERCLGIDIISDRIRRAERKRCRADLGNAHFVVAEAAECLDCLPAAVSLRRIFVLFPDPWPKRRHHKNRLLNRRFLAALAGRAAPSAELFFRTDHFPYHAEVEGILEDDPAWRLAAEQRWPFELPTVFQQKAAAYASLTARLLAREPAVTLNGYPSTRSG